MVQHCTTEKLFKILMEENSRNEFIFKLQNENDDESLTLIQHLKSYVVNKEITLKPSPAVNQISLIQSYCQFITPIECLETMSLVSKTWYQAMKKIRFISKEIDLFDEKKIYNEEEKNIINPKLLKNIVSRMKHFQQRWFSLSDECLREFFQIVQENARNVCSFDFGAYHDCQVHDYTRILEKFRNTLQYISFWSILSMNCGHQIWERNFPRLEEIFLNCIYDDDEEKEEEMILFLKTLENNKNIGALRRVRLEHNGQRDFFIKLHNIFHHRILIGMQEFLEIVQLPAINVYLDNIKGCIRCENKSVIFYPDEFKHFGKFNVKYLKLNFSFTSSDDVMHYYYHFFQLFKKDLYLNLEKICFDFTFNFTHKQEQEVQDFLAQQDLKTIIPGVEILSIREWYKEVEKLNPMKWYIEFC